MKSLKAGKYRHRITIEAEQEAQDENGDITTGWADAFPAITAQYGGIPMRWLPGPGSEYLAGEATRAEVEGRMFTRYLPGITAAMRVQWDGRIWNIKAPPLVDETARREITLMVGSGANNG